MAAGLWRERDWLLDEQEGSMSQKQCTECDGKGYINVVGNYTSGCVVCDGTGHFVARLKCLRCGQEMEHVREAEGCRDWQCPMQEPQ